MIARRTVGVHRWTRVDTEVRPQHKAGSGMMMMISYTHGGVAGLDCGL